MNPSKTIAAVFLFAFLAFVPAYAVDETDNSGAGLKGGSGLPIPRFASLRASDVNLRTGPGTRYPIDWVFTHQGMPVEITSLEAACANPAEVTGSTDTPCASIKNGYSLVP